MLISAGETSLTSCPENLKFQRRVVIQAVWLFERMFLLQRDIFQIRKTSWDESLDISQESGMTVAAPRSWFSRVAW